jgi:hypothetical protein
MKKGKVTASKFLEWFYSDSEDYLHAGESLVFNMKTNGYYKSTVKEIFDSSGYIPAHICTDLSEEIDDDDHEFESEELEFIDDITGKPIPDA